MLALIGMSSLLAAGCPAPMHDGGARCYNGALHPRADGERAERRKIMELGLAGATAVVTGGSKGMGRATARCLAEDGARVCILARGQSALDEAVAMLEAAGSPEAFGLSVDLGRADAIESAFRTVAERWGELNCLVNTIGPHAGHFFELTDDDFFAHFNIGTMAAVRCIRAALPLLRKASWARI